ncbi:MAG: serine/threonine protein kinase [Rhodobacteraceae bacterium]|nr:serine/threonine protein kinase [Paracoccaceae bacterium]
MAYKGEILHNQRNLTKRMIITNDDGNSIFIVIKAFRIPGLLRGYIDLNFRISKAQKSMNNANRLLELGVQTPDPIGCIEYLEYNCIRQCYYICRFWEQNYELSKLLYQGISTGVDSQIILRELASYTSKQHDRGILHLDYNPGNILARLEDNKIDFSLVDLNRLRFTQLSYKERISGLIRLTLIPETMRMIGNYYSKNYGADQEKFCRELERAHDRFWNTRNRIKKILGILK